MWFSLTVVASRGSSWPERYHLKVMGGEPFTPQMRNRWSPSEMSAGSGVTVRMASDSGSAGQETNSQSDTPAPPSQSILGQGTTPAARSSSSSFRDLPESCSRGRWSPFCSSHSRHELVMRTFQVHDDWRRSGRTVGHLPTTVASSLLLSGASLGSFLASHIRLLSSAALLTLTVNTAFSEDSWTETLSTGS